MKEGQLVGIQFTNWNPPNQFIASGVLRIVDGTGTVLLEKDSYQSNFSTIPSDISTTSSNRVDIYFESRQMELINFTLPLGALHKVCQPNFGEKNGQNQQKTSSQSTKHQLQVIFTLLLLTKFILGFSRDKYCDRMIFNEMCDENEVWGWSLSWTALTPGIVMNIFSEIYLWTE